MAMWMPHHPMLCQNQDDIYTNPQTAEWFNVNGHSGQLPTSGALSILDPPAFSQPQQLFY